MKKKRKVLVIAEIGVNHNGNLLIAKKLINLAKKSGADYVKFQSYKTDNLICKNTKVTNYQRRNIQKKINQYDLLKKYEISSKQHRLLINYTKKNNIKFISSPFDLDSLKLLFNLKIFDIKIASGEINNFILLREIAKRAKKIFLSSGMSTMSEISKALKVLTFYGAKKKNITVLHCHSEYPTDLKDVNLLAMREIQKKMKIDVGYSDHTLGSDVGISAVSLGAKVLEKHITINRNMKGPDHKASLNPVEFSNYVKSIRNTEILLGSNIKKPSNIEIENKKLVRKSIVAKAKIFKGEYFSQKNITCKRPEGGISPMRWNDIIGKKSKRNFKINEMIVL